MPAGQFHFAVGALFGLVITLFFIPLKKKWIVYLPFIITIFGFFAMIPDLPKVLVELPLLWRTMLASPVLTQYLHGEAFDKIFFYHGYLDRNTEYGIRESLGPAGFAITVFAYSLTALGYIIYSKFNKK